MKQPHSGLGVCTLPRTLNDVTHPGSGYTMLCSDLGLCRRC